MLAIVLDDDSHSRSVIGKLLSTLGYDQVLEASDIDEFDFFCKQNLNKTRLIISANRNEEGLDLPVSRITLKDSFLNLTPLVLMTERRRHFILNFSRSRLSRIDSYLRRPFGIGDLKDAIVIAHERRASFRNVLLIYSEETTKAIEATYEDDNQSHWKETIFVQSLSELKQKYEEHGFKIGGILLDPIQDPGPQVFNWITKIRKEFMGSSLILGTLSNNAKETFPYRIFSDLFFHEKEEWKKILSRMSRHLIHDWESKELMRRGRADLKKSRFEQVSKLLKLASKKNLVRYEILELGASLAILKKNYPLAVTYLHEAIQLNPCAPSLYLHLIECQNESEKKVTLRQAIAYCPKHPEITIIAGANGE